MTGEIHTPGPWLHDSGVMPPDGPGRYSDIYARAPDADVVIIASVNEMREFSPAEGAANARLIAAAPELLAVAKMIENAGDNMISTFQGPIYRAAKAAIAKAEGRS